MTRGDAISQAGELRSARVESLRALAALGVLFGHVYGFAHGFGPVTTSSFWHRVLLGGGFGVYLFFVLSGYLLYWPFAKRSFGGGEQISLSRYALNRALRILPLYYAVMVILLIVQERGGTLSEWWRWGLFAENFANSTFGKVDGVMWSLVVEVHFYVALPLLALLVTRLARGSLARAAIVIGAIGAAAFALRYATFLSVPAGRVDPILHDSLPSLFEFFALGMLLALLRVSWERRPPRLLDGALGHSDLWLAAAVPLWAIVFWRYHLEIVAGLASVLMLGACVLPLRAGRLISILEWRPLAVIGVASYSLYLWHYPIVLNIAHASWAPHGTVALGAVTIPLSLAAALLSYNVIEAPFLRLRRRWASPAPAPVAATTPPSAVLRAPRRA